MNGDSRVEAVAASIGLPGSCLISRSKAESGAVPA